MGGDGNCHGDGDGMVSVMVVVKVIAMTTLDAHPADSVKQCSTSAPATEFHRGHL
jgi:hypothetical protein